MDPVNPAAGSEQAALWNGAAGRAWVEAQPLLDRMFAPLQALLIDTDFAGTTCSVLDVGCGTGATTLAAAGRLGPEGRCTGIDISAPMIAAARTRAAQEGLAARFIHADAQTHAFAHGNFDTIVSRFGVMFFDDAVRAFANLRHAATHEAELRFLAWRGPEENPFMTTAERAAAPFVPDLPARRPQAPGQFAFADPRRVHRILAESGWTQIDIQPVDAACTFFEHELVTYFTRLGPLGRALHAVDERTRARIVDRVRAAFDPYVHGAHVRFDAACWRVSARASAAVMRQGTPHG